MNVSYIEYKFSDSRRTFENIIKRDEIAIASNNSFEEANEMENSKFLSTYVYSTALSVVLSTNAKLDEDGVGAKEFAMGYRALLGEIGNILKGARNCNYYYIQGVCVCAFFETTKNSEFKAVVDVCARISSIVDVWNSYRSLQGISFSGVIGVHYGKVLKMDTECLMHDGDKTVFIGGAIQKANVLSNLPVVFNSRTIVRANSSFYENLDGGYKNMFSWNNKLECYQTSIYNVEMKQWIKSKEEGHK